MTRTVCAKHAIITDQCRTNKGDDAVIEEAVQRIIAEFKEIAPHWPIGYGTEFHVKLEIERELEAAPQKEGK
jgi:hypothetical protein